MVGADIGACSLLAEGGEEGLADRLEELLKRVRKRKNPSRDLIRGREADLFAFDSEMLADCVFSTVLLPETSAPKCQPGLWWRGRLCGDFK